MATVYIIGAGASVHAGYPLASRLGDELYDWACTTEVPGVDAWRGYLESLRETFGAFADFEAILTDLVECTPNSLAYKLSRTTRGNTLGAIQVLIPEMFHAIGVKGTGTDLYSQLASQWHDGDVVISFNYDLACERAFKSAGLWEIKDGYGFDAGIVGIPASRTKILKLHGSINWMGLLFGGNMGFGQSSSVYDYRPAVFGARNFSFLGYDQDLQDELCKGISRSGGQPALILPVRNKRFFHPTFAGEEWHSF